MKGDQPMKKIAYVGIDYHMNVATIAVISEGEKDFYDTIRPANRMKRCIVSAAAVNPSRMLKNG
jgi:hypothetical protein